MVNAEDPGLPLVLICGDEGVGKHAIMQSLAGNPQRSAEATLRLDTKYYTAQLTVRCIDCASDTSELDPPPEAVILAFDSSRPSTFAAAKHWIEGQDVIEPAICICVANKSPPPAEAAHSPQLEDARSWCALNYYEYIEVSTENPDADRMLATADDQQGMKRVRSALEAHMWPGLQMREPLRTQPESIGASNDMVDRCDQPFTEQPSVDRTAPDSCSSGPATQQGINGHARNADEAKGSDSQLLAECLRSAAVETDLEDDFEKLMREMVSMRGRLQAMPDADRRKVAGDFMLQIHDQLGLSDDSSDDN